MQAPRAEICQQMSKRSKGKIASWNDDKGFGFITPTSGGKQIFVHIRAFANRTRRHEIGEVVTYSMSKDKQGRPCAANATLPGDKLKTKVARESNIPAILFAMSFMGAVGMSAASGQIPVEVVAVYLALSVITFVLYALDKSAARRGAWRTSESTLQLLGLAGGWPGALIAQKILRHKSKKASFRRFFWVTVVLNCAALAWLYTVDGWAFLSQLPITGS